MVQRIARYTLGGERISQAVDAYYKVKVMLLRQLEDIHKEVTAEGSEQVEAFLRVGAVCHRSKRRKRQSVSTRHLTQATTSKFIETS